MVARRVASARLLPILAVTLLAFGLRVWRLDFQALWWDEGISVFLANQDPAAILANRAGDVHPPLYFLLLRAWVQFAGSGAWATRFLSALLGTLCAPLFYQLGRRLADDRTGELAALILALSPFLLRHAQEVRMYALVPLLGLLSTYLMLRLLTQEDSLLWSACFIATAIALYTHYYVAFIPLFQTTFILGIRRRGLILRWLLTQFGLLLIYLPWLALVGSRLPASAIGKTEYERDVSVSLPDFFNHYLHVASLGYTERGALILAGAYALFLLLALLGIYHWWKGFPKVGSSSLSNRRVHRAHREQSENSKHSALSAASMVKVPSFGNALHGGRKPNRAGLALVLLYLGLPLLAGWLMNLRFPFAGFPRLLVFAAPAYYLLVAAGLGWLWRRSVPLGVMTLLVVVGVSGSGLTQHYTVLRHPEEDHRPLIARVQDLARLQDAVICDFTWQAGYFLSYYRGELPRLYLPPGQDWAANPTRMEHDLDQLMAEHRLVWYVAYQGLGETRGRNIEGYLSQEYYLALDEWYGYTRLLLYAGPQVPRQVEHQLEVELGDAIQLLGYSLGRDAVPVGEVLPLTLYWRATAEVGEGYKVFVHLLDADERVVAQRDAVPGGGVRPTTTWQVGEILADNYGVLIPPDTPPGIYQVEVGMYNPASGARLPVRVKGQAADDRVLLGSVRVIAPWR